MATDPTTRRVRRWTGGLLAVVAAAAAVLVTPAPPADAALTGDVTFSGHGYGHGRGLGQWGAYGYATTSGWDYTQIVGHYYGGTTLGSQGNPAITVALTAQDGADLVVTSGQDFVVGGYRVGAGSAARLTARSDGTFSLSTSYGCAKPAVWTTTVTDPRVLPTVEPGDDLQAMLSLCTATGTKQYRGEFSVVWAGNTQRTVNTVRMEDYLRGVVPRESPASWAGAAGGRGIEALKAQAVAARSYAQSESRSSYAKTCDTTACQVYGGAGTNLTSIEDPRTDAAVAGTAGMVLRSASGTVVRAEFSSSTGGYTAGGAFPAVPDAGDAASPYQNWTTTVPASTVAGAFGVGVLQSITVVGRNGLGADGGRATSVRIVGSSRTVTVTGNEVRSALGLRSDWFSITAVQSQPTVFQAPAVDGAAVQQVDFGQAGDVVLSCDFDGDGTSTLGVFRRGTFFISNVPGGARADSSFGFGQAGDQPLCGDWDGDGTETVGVFRAGTVFLRNSNSTGIADGSFRFGASTDTAVAGDWDGDGYATVGVWRSGTFFLTNSNIRPTTDAVVAYGASTDLPVTGDWDGDGRDTIGIYRGDTFYQRDANTPGVADRAVVFGARGDRPLAGRWTGGDWDLPGVARSY